MATPKRDEISIAAHDAPRPAVANRIRRWFRRRIRRARRNLERRIEPWQAAYERYSEEARAPRSHERVVGRLELARDFIPWYRSQGGSALANGRPWITFEAARVIEKRLRPTTRVFEYGSGGSTVFLGRRTAEVISIESDPDWYGRVSGAVTSLPGVTVRLIEPRPTRNADEAAFASTNPAFAGQTFVDYVAAIDGYPDHSFDLVLVDGRARPSCFFRSEPKVRIGGAIVLDDSERPAYQSAVSAARAAGWIERGRLGPKPFSPVFARTTIWTKTRDLADGP